MSTLEYPHEWDVLEGWQERVKFDGASRPDVGYVIRKKGFHQQIAVPYPPPYVFSHPLAYIAVSPHMPRELRIGNISERLTPTPRAYHIDSVLPWYFPHQLLETRDKSVSVQVFVIDPSSTPFICRMGAMRGYQNIDGDEIWYVYRGNGICVTELGILRYGTGDYLYIPKGFIYELHADSAPERQADTNKTIFVGIESTEPLLRSKTGMDDVPYSIRAVRVPEYKQLEHFPVVSYDCKNPYILAVKRLQAWSFVEYAGSPLASVGWAGTPYPFIINEKDINVPVVDTLHTDPTQFVVFTSAEEKVAVSVFRPRRVHSIPYYHDNTYDECMFLVDTYAPRAGSVGVGDMTFHPQGFCHGPQPNALRVSQVHADPKDNDWSLQRAVMFESRIPLIPTRESIDVELKKYVSSWIPRN